MGLLALVACGGGGDGGSGPPDPDPAKPARIVILPVTSNTIFTGLTLSLRAAALNAQGDTLPTIAISWSSSDASNAPVATNGVVTGANPTSATITAKSGELSASMPVVVVRLTTFTYTPHDTTLDPGQVISYSVTGQDAAGKPYPNLPVVWQSFSPAVATATSSGSVTAIEGEGGTIQLRLLLGDLVGTIWVTVAPAPVATVSLNGPAGPYWVNATTALTYTLKSVHGVTLFNRPVTWSTTDAAVATVTQAGVVTTHQSGTVHITLDAGQVEGDFPMTVQALPTFSQVINGIQRCGLTVAGDVYCWINDVPTLVSNGLHFSQLSGWLHLCGLTSGGQAYCWGPNNWGQLGDGTTTQRDVPTAVQGGLTFSQISVGYEYTCGVTSAGAGYCWGINPHGNLGDGTQGDASVPVPVSGGLTFSSIASSGVGNIATCGITTSHEAWCWGLNSDGEMGTGDSVNSSVPRQVLGNITWKSISPNIHTCGVDTSHTGYCWGPNVYGGLGDGSLVSTAAPHPVASGTYDAVSTGYLYTCGIMTGGSLACWGWNEAFQLGDGTQIQRTSPVTISNLTFSQVSAGSGGGCAVTNTGKIYCWGGTNHTPVLMPGQE